MTSEVERIVMPAAVGLVQYDVKVECPHCGKRLYLNQYPYNDDSTDYCHAEDLLGLAVFGTTDKPAKWNGLAIEYECCGCQGHFTVSEIDIF